MNNHGWSDGTLVPERNPWLTSRSIPTPTGLNTTRNRQFNPVGVALAVGSLTTGSAVDSRHYAPPVAIHIEPASGCVYLKLTVRIYLATHGRILEIR